MAQKNDYDRFARVYSDDAEDNAYNALYERPESLRLLGDSTPMVVPRGMGARLRARGFSEVSEFVPGDELTVAVRSIEAT